MENPCAEPLASSELGKGLFQEHGSCQASVRLQQEGKLEATVTKSWHCVHHCPVQTCQRVNETQKVVLG